MTETAPRTYFHGTNTLAKALGILENGIQPDMPSFYRSDYQPMDGFVYLASRHSGALRYARWPSNGRWSRLEQDIAKHPHGFIFEVPSTALTCSLVPDEDEVGMFMASYAVEAARVSGTVQIDGETVNLRDYAFRALPDDPEAARKSEVWTSLKAHLNPKLMTRIHFDDGVAEVGKPLLARMPAEWKAHIIGWGAGKVAHQGAVHPTACWRFAKPTNPYVDLGAQPLDSFAERVVLEDLVLEASPLSSPGF